MTQHLRPILFFGTLLVALVVATAALSHLSHNIAYPGQNSHAGPEMRA